ncbi:hypothetical protein TrLO_g14861 [Triparma laevis f. longispina]|uniref:FAD-binding PCMH-type domain-containing protein n=1 Tax=Triparma laevis f. longispina TaxID=1714387 RepID=A0A9W7FUC6_9STRA|nr:hypothetical protein TrLO_g14861 [Triparma laevis f. longispina]
MPPPPSLTPLTILVNEKKHVLQPGSYDPMQSLAMFLRTNLNLTGPKIGCGEGGCGACTCLLTTPGSPPIPINSCLKLLGACQNCHVLTTEGLGSSSSTFHQIQTAIADGNGSQCGFCTPGWVMTMASFLVENPEAGSSDVGRLEEYFDGNICRCTGYRPILEAFKNVISSKKFTKNETPKGCTGSCTTCKADCADAKGHCGGDIEDLCCANTPPPPPTNPKNNPPQLSPTFYNPTTLEQTYSILDLHQSKSQSHKIQVVSGHTGSGVSKYYNGTAPKNRVLENPITISIASVQELQAITTTNNITTIGSNVTLTSLITFLSTSPSPVHVAASRHISLVANTQVRAAGTWAGNLCMAAKYGDFPSDVYLTLTALNATVAVRTLQGQVLANVPVQHFCQNQQMQENTSILLSASFSSIPFPTSSPNSTTIARRFKVTQRARNAHAHVNCFIVAEIDNSSNVVMNSRVVFGGVTNTISLAPKTADSLVNTSLNEVSLSHTLQTFEKELLNDLGGINSNPELLVSQQFLLSTAKNCLYKFFLYANEQNLPTDLIGASDESIPRAVSSGLQSFGVDVDTLPVTAPVPKLSARLQASGEAKYAQDHNVPATKGLGLHGALVFAAKCNVRFSSINWQTLNPSDHPDVVGYVDDTDMGLLKKGQNLLTPGEPLFLQPGRLISHVGVVLGMVVANTEEAARAAAAEVAINYDQGSVKTAKPSCFTLADAIKYDSKYSPAELPDSIMPSMEKGDVPIDDALKFSERRVKGVVSTGSQKHFYFETQSAVAELAEGGGVFIRSSTQNVNAVQTTVARILGIANHKVVVRQKRAGGGYGGKISRCLTTACAAAVGAKKFGVPVKCANDRIGDMAIVGGREPMIIEYDVGFSNTGALNAVKFKINVDGGGVLDASVDSLQMALFWSDSAYNTPNFSATTALYKTNTSINTSCRAPGVAQSCFVYEEVLTRIGRELNMKAHIVQKMNLYKENDASPNGDTLHEVRITSCWDKLWAEAEVDTKLADVDAFNKSNRLRKRGVAISPVKYGVSGAGYKQMLQMSVYADDGSIRISHSGTEIGQGIDTKVAQVVAMKLGVDLDNIEFGESGSDLQPNTTCTGGSATSEVCCSAAIDACDKLLALLAPYEGEGDFSSKVKVADGDNVCLQIIGWSAPASDLKFQYYVWVATCVVVELDLLLGETSVLSADIQYDCGNQLNAFVDIGQIEGAFIMGLGYWMTERVTVDNEDGKLLTNGTWEYKPPMALDIPIQMNVRLLTDSPNNLEGNVLRSKATGEPPLIASSACYFALRDAIVSGYRDFGEDDEQAWTLSVPATVDARGDALQGLYKGSSFYKLM